MARGGRGLRRGGVSTIEIITGETAHYRAHRQPAGHEVVQDRPAEDTGPYRQGMGIDSSFGIGGLSRLWWQGSDVVGRFRRDLKDRRPDETEHDDHGGSLWGWLHRGYSLSAQE